MISQTSVKEIHAALIQIFFFLSLFGGLTWCAPHKDNFQALHSCSSTLDSLNPRWDPRHHPSQQVSRTAPGTSCAATMQVLLFQITTQLSKAWPLGICCDLTKYINLRTTDLVRYLLTHRISASSHHLFGLHHKCFQKICNPDLKSLQRTKNPPQAETICSQQWYSSPIKQAYGAQLFGEGWDREIWLFCVISLFIPYIPQRSLVQLTERLVGSFRQARVDP